MSECERESVCECEWLLAAHFDFSASEWVGFLALPLLRWRCDKEISSRTITDSVAVLRLPTLKIRLDAVSGIHARLS